MKQAPEKQQPFIRRSIAPFLGAGTTLLVFVLYLKTLAPTVLYYDPDLFYDSVMLQVQTYVLDIPNPTGYPTYVMLTHLFTYLPMGDVAYRVNLASAIYGVLAVLVIFAACLKLTRRAAPSAAAALLFGVGATFWSQAIIAEVYTLNVLLISLVLLVLLLWREKRRDRYLLLAAFLMGLSLSHHLTSGLLIPAALLFVGIVEWRKLFEWRLVLKGMGLFVVGLLPYLYLPVRASMDPPLKEADPATWEGFWVLVTGAGFENRMFNFGPGQLPGRFEMYADILSEQFHPAFLVVALLGAGYLLIKDRAAFALFGFLYASWLFYAVEYNIKDVYLYFIPTYLVICIFVAAGLGAALDAAESLLQRRARALRTAALAILVVPMLLAPLAGVERTYAAVDRSGDYEGREIVEAVARNAKPDATVLHNGSSLWYMSLVEGRRTDLRLVDPFPPGAWIARNGRWANASKTHLEEGPVYVLFPGETAEQNFASFRDAGLKLVPDRSGVFYKVVKE